MFYSAIFCILLITCVYGKSYDVCVSLNEESDDTNDEDDDNLLHDDSERRGPKGPVGPIGPEGPPGQCACDPNEVEDLREQIRQIQERRGPKGSVGSIGPAGPPGQCACEPSEVEELRKQIRQIQETYCTIGMRERRVRDKDITASSFYDYTHGPYAARLDNQVSLRGNAHHRGAWSAKTRNVGQWIQVDLLRPTRLTGVITQGRPGYTPPQWVTGFKISYGNYTHHLQAMLGRHGIEVTFEGNNDSNSYSTNIFHQPVFARYVRLHPQTWHNHISLRMEYLTC